MTIAGKPGDELGERDHEQYNETGAVEEIDMRKFLGVIERGEGNFSAYCPDLPGCVATGAAIRMHRQGMAEDNADPPISEAVSVTFVTA